LSCCQNKQWLKPISKENNAKPVGARLAREECTAVFQVLRVIVLRGQATLPQDLRLPRALYFAPSNQTDGACPSTRRNIVENAAGLS
jgi:hypothetical protein